MAAPTQVSIINLALSHIGQKSITAIDDGSVQQVETMKVWDFVLRETLKSYNWSFAKVKEALVSTSSYTPIYYTYAYEYPAKCLAIRKINYEDEIEKDTGQKFDVVLDVTNSAKRIVTDIVDAYIEYTYYIEVVTLFSDYFISSLSRRLAAELAVPLNGDKDMAKENMDIFNNLIREAYRHDSSESYEDTQSNESSSFIDARD